MVKFREVNDENKYYEQLNIGIDMSTMWNTLQTKSEYGSNRSEKGYQSVAKSMAGTIARALNLNPDLAEVLTMCKGAFFPAKGKEGKKCVMQYLQQHNIQMSEADLARNFIEYGLDKGANGGVTTKFDQLLKELFDETQEPHTPEVQIAKICNESIEGMKKIERYSTINQVDLLYKLSKDVENECIQAGKPVRSRKLEEMLKHTPEEKGKITEKEKEAIFKRLDIFVEYARGNSAENSMAGIYEYIEADDFDQR